MDTEQSSLEEFFECCTTTIDTLEFAAKFRCGNGGVGGAGVGGGKILPEEGVVDVAAGVESDDRLQFELLADVVVCEGGGVGREGVVEVCDVGLVVL